MLVAPTTAIAVVVGVALVLLCVPEGAVAPPSLIEIQEKRLFDEWTVDSKHGRAALVYFYAHWSPVCKAFTKEYGKVANFFGRDTYSEEIMITKIDGPNFHQLSRSLGIESFPYVLLYSIDELGKYEKYTGELESEELIKWVSDRLHPRMLKKGKKIPPKPPKRGIA